MSALLPGTGRLNIDRFVEIVSREDLSLKALAERFQTSVKNIQRLKTSLRREGRIA